MQLTFIISLTIILLMISYQDYISREVNWILFPLLAATAFFFSLTELESLKQLFLNVLINIAFILAQLFLFTAYFIIRYKKSLYALSEKLGLGDVLFLIAACFLFSPLTFLVFYVSSLLFSLIIYSGWIIIWKKSFKNSTIPMAGLQSAFLILFTYFNFLLSHKLTDDSWLLDKLAYIQ